MGFGRNIDALDSLHYDKESSREAVTEKLSVDLVTPTKNTWKF